MLLYLCAAMVFMIPIRSISVAVDNDNPVCYKILG